MSFLSYIVNWNSLATFYWWLLLLGCWFFSMCFSLWLGTWLFWSWLCWFFLLYFFRLLLRYFLLALCLVLITSHISLLFFLSKLLLLELFCGLLLSSWRSSWCLHWWSLLRCNKHAFLLLLFDLTWCLILLKVFSLVNRWSNHRASFSKCPIVWPASRQAFWK